MAGSRSAAHFNKPRAASEASLERKCEATMNKHLGRAFLTVVRPLDTLRAILDRDPYKSFRLAPTAKRVVTFLRERPKSEVILPIERDGAGILRIEDREVFSACSRPARASLHEPD